MSTIHVIYDPKDIIEHRREQNKRAGISVAVLQLKDFPRDKEDLKEVVQKLVTLLLEETIL